MQLMLWDLQSPINIGMILRTAEVYQVGVLIFDPRQVLNGAEARRTISDFACGALQRCPPRVFDSEHNARAAITGRTIATTISPDADSILDIRVGADDCVIVGNEYDGLPDAFQRASDARVTISMPPSYLPKPPSYSPIDPMRSAPNTNEGAPNLNVAAAAAIVMFEVYWRNAEL